MIAHVKGSPGRLIVGRLPHDGDLLSSIRQLAEENGVKAAVFWVIGAVKRARVTFYSQAEKAYRTAEFNMPLEILSCIGNIGQLKGETAVHAHLVLGDEKGAAYGGHLEKGTIIFSAEIFLLEVEDATLTREYDEVTGLNLFKL